MNVDSLREIFKEKLLKHFEHETQDCFNKEIINDVLVIYDQAVDDILETAIKRMRKIHLEKSL